MKLLYCIKCRSIFSLSSVSKKCDCGKTEGKYIDSIYAIYYGRYAEPIGIDNNSFMVRMASEKNLSKMEILDKDVNKYIKCWHIESNDCCDTFKKVTKKEYLKK